MTTTTEAEQATEATEICFQSTSLILAKSGKLPTVQILAYSGGLMTVGQFGPTVIDLSGLEISGSTTLLSDHNSALPGVVGSVAAAVVDGQLVARGTLSRSGEAGRQIIALALDGVSFEASVGAQVLQSRQVRPTETVNVNGRVITAGDGGFVLVSRSRLREISINSLGADSETSVAIKAHKMTKDANTEATTPVDVQSVLTTERNRVAQIDATCCGSWGSNQHAVDELRAQAVAETISLEAMQAGLLGIVRASRPEGPSGRRKGAPTPTTRTLTAGLLLRANHDETVVDEFGEGTATEADRMRSWDLIDFCRASLELDHIEAPLNKMELVKAALSTQSLPIVLGDAANKALLAGYRDTPASWRAFADVRSTNDFKTHHALRPSFVGGVEEVGVGGEIKYGNLDEADIEYSVGTFAKNLGIDRQHLINDDSGFIDQALPAMGRAAMRKLSDLVWSTIMDSTTHFTSGNGNLGEGAGSALDAASLATAIQSMRAQTDAEGNNVDVAPVALVVSPPLEQTAQALLQSEFIERSVDVPTGNALRSALKLVVEPRISNTGKFTGASATEWYVFGAPVTAPVLVAFLQGKRTPTAEFFDLSADVSRLQVSYRVYHDYGAAMGDYRSGYKANGS